MRFVRTTHPKYHWEVSMSFSIRVSDQLCHDGTYPVFGKYGNLVLELSGRVLTVYRGYHFDGCSLAPDYSRALKGCCVHDALLQICELYPQAMSEDAAHRLFREVLKRDKFPLYHLYYWFASKFYSTFKKMKSR